MKLFSNIGNAIAAWNVWNRLKEAQMKGKLLTALTAIGGAVVTAVVAKLTTACPNLLSNVGPLVTASLGGAFAYVKLRENWKGSIFVGAATAFIASGTIYLQQLCGPDFFTTLPTIATAGIWVGVMAWLRMPKA